MKADRYSRMVGLLKVILPLMALALLSTLFLLSRVVDPEAVIPFADQEIQERLRDQQVTGPLYHGTSADGDKIAFAAEKLITLRGQAKTNSAEDVTVTIDMASGTQILLEAAIGRLNMVEDRADLEDDVTINTSTGYLITSDHLIAQLSALNVESPGPVAATGPLGRLDAGAMSLRTETNGETTQLLFTDGVKLLYDPKVSKID